jgi:shikimate dehydrogenase
MFHESNRKRHYDMSGAPTLKLGLIGDNIAASRAPDLHRIAGRLNNMDVQYDRLIPKELNQTFDQVLESCRDNGYQALNITYPYKEHVVSQVTINDPMVRAIAAVNTVVFDGTLSKAYNTDYTGFIAAYEQVRASAAPGVCCLVGTGGVGRALAFGLVKLGADEIRLFDRDSAKAQQLAYDLNALDPQTVVTAVDDLDVATANCDGLLNGTPLGMVGYPGSAFELKAIANAAWVFDAVYTPIETMFLQNAKAAGAQIISGYELFFFQGVHAWRHFSGLDVDTQKLRTAL